MATLAAITPRAQPTSAAIRAVMPREPTPTCGQVLDDSCDARTAPSDHSGAGAHSGESRSGPFAGSAGDAGAAVEVPLSPALSRGDRRDAEVVRRSAAPRMGGRPASDSTRHGAGAGPGVRLSEPRDVHPRLSRSIRDVAARLPEGVVPSRAKHPRPAIRTGGGPGAHRRALADAYRPSGGDDGRIHPSLGSVRAGVTGSFHAIAVVESPARRRHADAAGH